MYAIGLNFLGLINYLAACMHAFCIFYLGGFPNDIKPISIKLKRVSENINSNRVSVNIKLKRVSENIKKTLSENNCSYIAKTQNCFQAIYSGKPGGGWERSVVGGGADKK